MDELFLVFLSFQAACAWIALWLSLCDLGSPRSLCHGDVIGSILDESAYISGKVDGVDSRSQWFHHDEHAIGYSMIHGSIDRDGSPSVIGPARKPIKDQQVVRRGHCIAKSTRSGA